MREITWTRLVDGEPLDYDAFTRAYENIVNAREPEEEIELEPETEGDETNAVATPYANSAQYDADLESSSIISASVELPEEAPDEEIARETSPSSGLFNSDLAPKPTLHKLAALRHAYLD